MLPGNNKSDMELNQTFSQNATNIRALVHLFSPGIVKKIKQKYADHDSKELFYFSVMICIFIILDENMQ